MRVSFRGEKCDFSRLLADWIARDAKLALNLSELDGREVKTWNLETFAAVMEGKDAKKLLELLQLMVNNRTMIEILIGFAVRYKSACLKASVQDVQDAIDLIKVMEVKES